MIGNILMEYVENLTQGKNQGTHSMYKIDGLIFLLPICCEMNHTINWACKQRPRMEVVEMQAWGTLAKVFD